MKKNKTPWLASITNFNTFVIKAKEGNKKVKIYDLDNPEISFQVDILGETYSCESSFGVVDSNKKLVSIMDFESYLIRMQQQNDQAVIIQLHDYHDKILVLSAFI